VHKKTLFLVSKVKNKFFYSMPKKRSLGVT
jgi:hypothetical protein